MKNLKCNAEKCVYNDNCECFAGKICVDGTQAVTTADTYCTTFRENENPSFSSDAGCCCQQKVCSAPAVQINDLDASCNTFKAR